MNKIRNFMSNLALELEKSPAMLIVISVIVVSAALLNFAGIIDAVIILVAGLTLYFNIKDYRKRY